MAATVRPPLSRPQRYLIRMAVFLILAGFIAFILYKQIWQAFLANPGLNGLIVGVMAIGIILAVRQVARLFREIRWVNDLATSDPNVPFVAPQPLLLAPMVTLLGNHSEQPLSVAMTRSVLDSVGSRLDEGREIVRYLAGLLVFLGLLGTFWGLIDTVGSVGKIISSLRTGTDAAILFDELKSALSGPLQGMGLSFSASLFGLAGSLILGFLDLQAGQAQNRFYNELEDWLATATADAINTNAQISPPAHFQTDLAQALNRLSASISDSSGGAPTSPSMVNLANGIQSLLQTMRTERQIVREWIEGQAARDKEIKALLERLTQERIR